MEVDYMEEENVSPTVYESVVIDSPRQEVWGLVRDFNSLPEWHPAISESEIKNGSGIGSVRQLTTAAGGNMKEKLLALSDAKCEYVYEIVETPMPIKNYIATIRFYEVTATDQTFAEWYAYFNFVDMSAKEKTLNNIGEVFRSGLQALAERFE